MLTFAPLQPMSRGTQFRALRLHAGSLIDPILGVDHAWMSGPTFPPHPHAGFSAVSYLFVDSKTGIRNKDSLGGRHFILPGGLHWTAAGRGVVHEEVVDEVGKTAHMLQIFVNLPKAKQAEEPFALCLDPRDVPVVTMPGIKVRVPIGEFGGQASPLVPPTPLQLLDITLNKGRALDVPVASGAMAFVLPVSGSLLVNGQPVEGKAAPVPVLAAQDAPQVLRLEAVSGNATAALFSGSPLGQPVFWRGPMAMASGAALEQAVAAYERGEFGTL